MFKLRKRTLKDQDKRIEYRRLEMTRNLYKSIIHSSVIPEIIRVYAQDKLHQLPRNSAFARIRNRCIMTSRPKGVIGQYNINRIKFRELAQEAKIPGIK